MSRGVLMYAHNNSEIDYLKIACANALMVKRNLDVPVTLVTDKGTLSWGNKTLGVDFLKECFENIIDVKHDNSFNNKRTYSDVTASKTLQFYNCNHWEAFYLSPYDETLFIDADYLIMSDALSACWGSYNDFMISSRIIDTGETKDPYFKYIDEFGILQYWATVIYFKKTRFSKFIFDTMRTVQENYEYYKNLYFFPNGMFRNDNAVSVAIHMYNGFTNNTAEIIELPIRGLLMSWDKEDIRSVNGINDITVYTTGGDRKSILSKIKNQDLHVMNKWAANRHSDKLIELYRDTK